MLLYHGSNVIIEKPQLLNQRRGLDFGTGFYLTSNKFQAERFSNNVARRVGSGKPIISIFEFDMKTAEKLLDILRFQTADHSWLEFIVNNRQNILIECQYDLVIGPVANDDVLPTIMLYINGQLDANLTISALKTRKLVDQFCFKSEKALTLLNYIRNEAM